MKFASLLLLFLLAGCGGAAPASSSSAQPSTPATGSAPAKPVAPASAAAKPESPSAAAKPVPSGVMLIPYSQPAAAFATLWIAQEKGLFKKYGLNAEIRNLQPPTDVQAVVSGEAPIGMDGSLGIGAIAGGAPITFIAVPGPIYTQSIFGQASMTSLKDLVGKSVGVTARGGSSDVALRTVLAKEGIDVSKLNIANLRDDSTILASLTGGSVQAAILTSPNTLRAKQAGFKELAYLPDMKIQTVNNSINVNKPWAQQHPADVENFLKALLEGIKIAKTDPATAKTIIAQYTKLDDQALLDESYNTASKLWAAYPLMQDANFQNVMNQSTEESVKAHKPSDFYDNSYLEKLRDFVQGLYPQGIPS